MPDQLVDRLRAIRNNSSEQLHFCADDLKKFVRLESRGFFRLPGGSKTDFDISTSCTCLMAIALSLNQDSVYKDNPNEEISKVFTNLYAADWNSSKIGKDNAFTTVLVLRALGFLIEAKILTADWLDKKRDYQPGKLPQSDKKSIREIAEWLTSGSGIDRFNLEFDEKKYPASSTLVYWFVDGVDRCGITLGIESWKTLSEWAENDFHRGLSIVMADHDALMDPIAMAMAACLCSRLRSLAKKQSRGATAELLQMLPVEKELERGIKLLFDRQARSGIWPKYFPLFDYPNGGSNYCFTFEMLEAIVKEFGHTEQVLLSSLINENSLEHIDNALQWCSENRMRFRYLGDDTTQEYEGWNSGGQLKSLSAGEPESWATAVVYMFLWEVSQFMTKVIQARLLQKYKARQLPPGNEQWERIIDIDVIIPRETDMTVKKTLEKFIIHGAEKIPENAPGKLSGRRSVLLFGPPGTSKTQFVRALASKLTWPLIEIDPSAFLTNGIDNIYARSKEIFEDFEDLSRVVLFFDEMDALVHTRNNKDEPFDLTSRFLTTSMLPKLAKLHDDAKAVFFFATNDLDAFDPAIKRPGRFDLLLCVGPPSWNRILDELAIVVKEMNCRQEVEKLKHKLESFDNLEEPVKDTLNRLTFSETKRFIEILTENSIGELRNIDTITEDEFKKTIKELEKTITLSKSKSSESGEQADTVYKRYLIQQKSSQLQ